MNYPDFVHLSELATKALASGHFKEAEDHLTTLLMSDISDVDKARLCLKMVIVYDRKGDTDEVLAWFDKGIAYEQPFFRYEAAVEKARYLADLGRCNEAVAVFEDLLKQCYVSEAEKEEFRKELRVLLSRAIGQWK